MDFTMRSETSMPLSTSPTQLHFYCEAPFKGIARVEGLVTLGSAGVTFEYAMPASDGTTPRGSVCKFLRFEDITSIELRKHWLSASRLRFRTKTPKVIETYPTTDPSVFEIEVSPQSRSSLNEFNLGLQKAFERHSTGDQTGQDAQ